MQKRMDTDDLFQSHVIVYELMNIFNSAYDTDLVGNEAL